MKIVLGIAGVLVVALCALGIRFIILGQNSQKMVMNLGIVDGKLTPCVKESNCFHSGALNNEEFLKEDQKNKEVLGKIKKICLQEGLHLEKETEDYLYFTHKSSLFGFIDDVEFYFDSGASRLHFRSASRVGNSDLGVNEKRVRGLLRQL